MPSLKSRAIIAKYWLTGSKRIFSDIDQLHKSIRNRPTTPQIPRSTLEQFEVTRNVVQGYPTYQLRPHRQESLYHILYLHGGAYIHRIEPAHWNFLNRLTESVHCTVTVPLYPLAPQHTVDETVAFVEECYEKYISVEAPSRQVLMGDSAGGALSLYLAMWLAKSRRPQPREVVLISPWLDISVEDPTIAELDPHDPYLAPAGLREAGRLYAPGIDPRDPRVSPLYGDLSGLGPVALLIGTRDILLADARRFRARAEESGLRLDYREYEGMFHGWILQNLPEAQLATLQLIEVLNRR